MRTLFLLIKAYWDFWRTRKLEEYTKFKVNRTHAGFCAYFEYVENKEKVFNLLKKSSNNAVWMRSSKAFEGEFIRTGFWWKPGDHKPRLGCIKQAIRKHIGV